MPQRLLQMKPLLDTCYIACGAMVAQAAVVSANISEPRVWLGLSVPYWFGWVLFFAALFFGAALSVHQETAVDKYIKHPKLKPLYSLGFGFFVTLFGVPLRYPSLTIWDLILPALCFAAIGSQVIYYVISFSSSPELWKAAKARLLAVITGRTSNADDN